MPQVEQGFGMGITVRPVLGIAVMLVLMTRHNRAINMLFFRKLISFFILIILSLWFIMKLYLIAVKSYMPKLENIHFPVLACTHLTKYDKLQTALFEVHDVTTNLYI